MRNRRGKQAQWKWYHGLAFYVAANAATFGIERLVKRSRGIEPAANDDKAFYKKLNEPVFAPPSWAFGPAWTFNGLSLLWGTLRVLNMPRNTKGRQGFLGLQAAFWLAYVSFTPVFFGLRSPVLGALITNLTLGLTAASEYQAFGRLKDKPAGLSQLSTLIWLVVASATANTTALWNRDPLLKTPAPQQPVERLLKKQPV